MESAGLRRTRNEARMRFKVSILTVIAFAAASGHRSLGKEITEELGSNISTGKSFFISLFTIEATYQLDPYR